MREAWVGKRIGAWGRRAVFGLVLGALTGSAALGEEGRVIRGLTAGFAPQLRSSFPGLLDNHTAVPPDTQGAVGPEHLVIALNSEVAIQKRSGRLLRKMSLADFWRPTGFTNTFDPKVIYDPLAKRFVITTISDRSSARSALLIGWTRGIDPMGEWDLFAVDVDGEDRVWADYPNIGYNERWVGVTANMVDMRTNSFSRSDIYVFSKAAMGEGRAQFTRFSDTNIFTIIPAMTFAAGETNLYLLTELGTNNLRVSRIEGEVGREVYRTNYAITPAVEGWTFSPGRVNFAPQKGSEERIYVNDSRMQWAVHRNGALWGVHTVFLPIGTNVTRSAIQWWQLSTNGQVLQRGRIDGGGEGKFYAFPSIAVNRADDVLIGYSSFGSNQYASAEYAWRLGSDPKGVLRPGTVLKEGLAPYYRVRSEQDKRNRWGDFSSTAVDPLNDVDMWTFQEYAAMPDEIGDRWGTWWGEVAFQPVAPPLILEEPRSLTVEVQGSAVRVDLGVTGGGPLEYTWYFDDVEMAGENSAFLEIRDFQSARVGAYHAVVRNAAGYARSEKAMLGFAPPVFTVEPSARRVLLPGTPVTLTAVVRGTLPMAYQWKKDGKELAGATAPELNIGQFQIGDVGVYELLASNVAGVEASAAVELGFTPPAIRREPEGQSVLEGSTLTLRVEAEGTPPLGYQWFRNGAPVGGGTNETLVLRGFSGGEAGEYFVEIRNVAGEARSRRVMGTVREAAAPRLSQARLLPEDVLELRINAEPGGVIELQSSNDLEVWAKVYSFRIETAAVMLRVPAPRPWGRLFYRVSWKRE